MIEFDECKCCVNKVTTCGCLNCSLHRLKTSITEIKEFIDEHKNNINNFIFYISNSYYDIITRNIDFSLIADNNIRITNPEKFGDKTTICMVIDKTKFDWGNIVLEGE